MSYYTAFGLTEEPFSNSPSPDFFFRVPGRVEVLNLLEVSVRLRRGLNVVLGEVGTGKTTLCRQLIRNLGEEDAFVTHLLLDPYFSSPMEFLRVLYSMLFQREAPDGASEWLCKEEIKKELLQRAVEHKQVVTLIIDEGQKIQEDCLELLREFLNFETNENKLLQIVIFAQNEFEHSMRKFPNLVDRVDALHKLKPLSFMEMREMIRYRMKLASKDGNPPELFTTGAYWALHRITRGYPRKVVALCHKSLLALLMLGRPKATFAIVYKASGRNAPHVKWGTAGAVCAGCVAAAFLYVTPPNTLESVEPSAENARGVSMADSTDSLNPEEPSSPMAGGQLALGQTTRMEGPPRERGNDTTPLPTAGEESIMEPVLAEAPVTALEIAETDGEAPAIVCLSAAKTEDTPENQEVEDEWAPLVPEKAVSSSATSAASRDVKAVAAEQEVLGVLPLAKNELISKAISKVYGIYRTGYLDKVLQVNPHILDPDHVLAGTRVTYPALVSSKGGELGEGYWLRLASFDTLEQAVGAMEHGMFAGHDVRLLPVTDSSGKRFHVVAAKRYRKEVQARQALDAFPSALREQALIVRHWEPEAVLYTDHALWGETLATR